MERFQNNFPAKRDFVFLGIVAFMALSGRAAPPPEAAPVVPVVTPVEPPKYEPFIGPLPNAVRRACLDITVLGRRECK